MGRRRQGQNRPHIHPTEDRRTTGSNLPPSNRSPHALAYNTQAWSLYHVPACEWKDRRHRLRCHSTSRCSLSKTPKAATKEDRPGHRAFRSTAESTHAQIGQLDPFRRRCILVDGSCRTDVGHEGRHPLAAHGCLSTPGSRRPGGLSKGSRPCRAAPHKLHTARSSIPGRHPCRWKDAPVSRVDARP